MTREEAIEIYKGLMNPNIIEAFEALVPELKEIGYDMMREQIIRGFENWKSNGNLTFNNLRVDDILVWLEKQKESLHIPETCKENANSFTDEDEKIRKEIVGVIQKHYPNTPESYRWISWLEKQKEQKPNNNFLSIEQQMEAAMIAIRGGMSSKSQEWSEEDEKMFQESLTDIIYAKNELNKKGCEGLAKSALDAFNWLNTRFKYLRPKPHKWYIKKGHWYMCIVDKPEYGWTKGKVYQSPEDNRIETDYKGSLTNWPNIEPWFRPATHSEIPDNQPSWKPSKEQMEALKAMIDSPTQYQCIVNELKTLYDELKKL